MNRKQWTMGILSLLLAGRIAAAGKGGGAPSLEARFGGMVSTLVAAVRDGDDAAIDRVTCNDIVAGGRALKQQRMGRIAADRGPALADAVEAGYRNEVHAFFDRLARQGRSIRSLDAGGVTNRLGGELEKRSWLARNGRRIVTQAVTGRGVLHLRCDPDDHTIDIPVERVGTRWCLYPVSLP